jgi:hypothetical protein
LDKKKARVEATTTLWDCVSQMARNYYRPLRHPGEMPTCVLDETAEKPASVNLVETYGRSAARKNSRKSKVVAAPGGSKVKVRRPAHLAFESIR